MQHLQHLNNAKMVAKLRFNPRLICIICSNCKIGILVVLLSLHTVTVSNWLVCHLILALQAARVSQNAALMYALTKITEKNEEVGQTYNQCNGYDAMVIKQYGRELFKSLQLLVVLYADNCYIRIGFLCYKLFRLSVLDAFRN